MKKQYVCPIADPAFFDCQDIVTASLTIYSDDGIHDVSINDIMRGN